MVTVGSLLLFGLAVILVSGQYVYYGFRSNTLRENVANLKQMYSSRAPEVAEYLGVKQIVTSVTDIQARRFRYKEILDQIFQVLPAETKLASVSFGARGIVLVSVRLNTLLEYDQLLANIEAEAAQPDFLFPEVAERRMTRERSGDYLVNLEMAINNGNR